LAIVSVVMRHGSEALERLDGPMEPESRPAVILMDTDAERWRHRGAVRIKGDPNLKNLPGGHAELLAAKSRRGRGATGLGANAYVVKPVGFHFILRCREDGRGNFGQ